ncbi:Aminoacyl-tRNA synthetase, class Ia [Dillenia turbinata]|uniref:Aminoacyl-tRNA synthetase, class Ia n=1 Tax=Dillenia turbinata TaxID=194707 RepID=A0AAN8VMW3_9MAGN
MMAHTTSSLVLARRLKPVGLDQLGQISECHSEEWLFSTYFIPTEAIDMQLCPHVPLHLGDGNVRRKSSNSVYIVAESRLSELPIEKPKAVCGDALVALKYQPLFNYFVEFSEVAFRVFADNYVTDDSGTGIVDRAPAFGEDDYRVCLENQIINKVMSFLLGAISFVCLGFLLVVFCEETFHGISNMSFVIIVSRPALMFSSDAILSLYAGNTEFAKRLQTSLLSRDHANLKSEFQLGNGKVRFYLPTLLIKVDCIKDQPAVEVACILELW